MTSEPTEPGGFGRPDAPLDPDIWSEAPGPADPASDGPRRPPRRGVVLQPQRHGRLLGLREQVDRVDAAAGPQGAEQQAQRRQAVGHDQRDGLARRHALRGQPCADAAARGEQRAVVETRIALGGERVDGVGLRGRRAVDQLSDRVHVRPYLSKNAPKISRSPGMRSAIGREMRVMFM